MSTAKDPAEQAKDPAEQGLAARASGAMFAMVDLVDVDDLDTGWSTSEVVRFMEAAWRTAFDSLQMSDEDATEGRLLGLLYDNWNQVLKPSRPR